MNKTTTIWFITAALLVFFGLIIFSAQMSVYGWDFTKLGSDNYETNTNIIIDDFSEISINTDMSNVSILPSSDGECRVVCYEEKKAKHEVYVDNSVLKIEMRNEKSWYDYAGFNFSSPKISVYLPKTEYRALSVTASTGDIYIPSSLKIESLSLSLSTGIVNCNADYLGMAKIKATTGDIFLENASVGSLDVSLSTGKVRLARLVCDGEVNISQTTGDAWINGMRCKSLTSSATTGDLDMSSVIASGKIKVTRGAGDVEFEACDAAEIFIETRTGDVEGSLLSEKVFVANTKTGDIEVPRTDKGGRCEVTTRTGDIEIEISRRAYD